MANYCRAVTKSPRGTGTLLVPYSFRSSVGTVCIFKTLENVLASLISHGQILDPQGVEAIVRANVAS